MNSFAHTVIWKIVKYFIRKLFTCCCHGNQFKFSNNVNIYCWWCNALLQSHDYDIIQIMRTNFVFLKWKCLCSLDIWCILIDVLWKDWNNYTGNITAAIWYHYRFTRQFNWSMNCNKELSYLYRVNKSVSIMNILSQQIIILKITSNNYTI